MKYFGDIIHHEGLEKSIMEKYIPGKMGLQKRRLVQDITDDLQISALDAGHLA
jgi:hypothetical protein